MVSLAVLSQTYKQAYPSSMTKLAGQGSTSDELGDRSSRHVTDAVMFVRSVAAHWSGHNLAAAVVTRLRIPVWEGPIIPRSKTDHSAPVD